jgi:hypothetical protein
MLAIRLEYAERRMSRLSMCMTVLRTRHVVLATPLLHCRFHNRQQRDDLVGPQRSVTIRSRLILPSVDSDRTSP